MNTIEFDVELRRGIFRRHCRFASDERVLAMVGPSGAGKSTLLDAIAGLLQPLRGCIRILGDTVFDSAQGIDQVAHRRGIGYVFQDARLFPHLSVAGNLDFAARYAAGRPMRLVRSKVIELLALGDLLPRDTRQLSGGERQRVALGRALLTQPKLLLLDEPMSHIDQPHRESLLPYLVHLRDQLSLPMLYVSHHRDELVRLAQAEYALQSEAVGMEG